MSVEKQIIRINEKLRHKNIYTLLDTRFLYHVYFSNVVFYICNVYHTFAQNLHQTCCVKMRVCENPSETLQSRHVHHSILFLKFLLLFSKHGIIKMSWINRVVFPFFLADIIRKGKISINNIPQNPHTNCIP